MAQEMDDPKVRSGAEIDFHHPYIPYDIQKTLMHAIYDILEKGGGQVGILESPTGTGKSLSLICAALTWLRHNKKREFEDGLGWSGEAADEPDWLVKQVQAEKRRALLRQREEMEARLARIRIIERNQKERHLDRDSGNKRAKKTHVESSSDAVDEDDQFVLDEYDSDPDNHKKASGSDKTLGLSTETLALMGKLGMGILPKESEAEEIEEETKVFYCSRTHSQLGQFINELRRVTMPAALPPLEKDPGRDLLQGKEDFKHVTLGSRKNLCINSRVAKLGSLTAINERCVELQQSATASERRCTYLPNRDNASLVSEFRDHTLAAVRDIEDLGALGKSLGICPYYASRDVIKPAEIVTLPYPLLLQKTAREALGIKLQGHIVIVDEAHNLMDAISGIYGVTISLAQLKAARRGLGIYLQKFRNKLKGKNRVYVAQVVRLLDSFSSFLESKVSPKPNEVIIDPAQLLMGKGVDQINLYKLLTYMQESRLARKIESYLLHIDQTAVQQDGNVHTVERDVTAPTLQNVTSLLHALNNPSREGKLFCSTSFTTSPTPSIEVTLKYMLLDPAEHFREIVSEARAVILAGGTMSPMSDYTDYLLSYLPHDRITTKSCGHVIPKENLLAWTLSTGPTGKAFEFTFEKRKGREGEEMIDELGSSLLNICNVAPDGVVVFFPSYAYLATTIARWQGIQDNSKPMWSRLAARKAIFQESKESKLGENILRDFAEAIDSGNGGLLLSVVGGKMSEGINFSDKLGRCVVIVGLPFPNIMNGEWQAKLRHIESKIEERLDASGMPERERREQGKKASREYYENACMRAVNQSVGRAIRHRGDYASIIMIDKRFGAEKIKCKLPGWIQSGLVQDSESKQFVQMMGNLGAFFRARKT